MAFPTAVNSQITDAISQANVQTLGTAPAMALGSLYQAVAQALATAAHNATFAQQQLYITAQAATAQGVALIYGQSAAALAVRGIPAPPPARPAPPPAAEPTPAAEAAGGSAG